MVSHTFAGDGQSSPRLRRIYCLGYARFISLVRVSCSRESSQLLSNDPRTRYTLDELRMHPFFFDSKGRNAFDEILREAAADTYG